MNEKPDFLTDDQWAIELDIRKKHSDARQRIYQGELKNNPPLPPWIKYPETGMVDMFWSMGAGEEYLDNYIFNYFSNARAEDIEKYKRKYPEPVGWRGWYDS